MTTLYKMHDVNPSDHGGCQPVPIGDAKRFNAEGFGIFWTVNDFNGARKISNLTRINAWAVDIDTGTKAEQLEIIKSAPLRPTMIIEVKRGYHVYYRAIDAKPENWNAIMLDRLVPFFGADKNARDLARILRVPGYWHMKNPTEPFLVKKVFEFPVAYTQTQIAQRFQECPTIAFQKKAHQGIKKIFESNGGTFWSVIFDMDCHEALSILSGTEEVNFETYTYRVTSKGKMNIFVNGKGTSCWIDASGRIGSLDGGGPTILQWLKWYGHDWKTVIKIVKKYFPEVAQIGTRKD